MSNLYCSFSRSIGIVSFNLNICFVLFKGMNFNAPVQNFGDHAQTGGSRDVYHKEVDRSSNKTVVGDNADIGSSGSKRKSKILFLV